MGEQEGTSDVRSRPHGETYLVDFTLALTAGLVFQYFAIVPMKHLTPGKGILAALKADTLSLAAFEIGMFAWIAVARFAIFRHDVPPTAPEHWLMMQIAMMLGFATAYPVNWILLRTGVKEAM